MAMRMTIYYTTGTNEQYRDISFITFSKEKGIVLSTGKIGEEIQVTESFDYIEEIIIASPHKETDKKIE